MGGKKKSSESNWKWQLVWFPQRSLGFASFSSFYWPSPAWSWRLVLPSKPQVPTQRTASYLRESTWQIMTIRSTRSWRKENPGVGLSGGGSWSDATQVRENNNNDYQRVDEYVRNWPWKQRYINRFRLRWTGCNPPTRHFSKGRSIPRVFRERFGNWGDHSHPKEASYYSGIYIYAYVFLLYSGIRQCSLLHIYIYFCSCRFSLYFGDISSTTRFDFQFSLAFSLHFCQCINRHFQIWKPIPRLTTSPVQYLLWPGVALVDFRCF